MIGYIEEWLQNLVFYLVIVAMVLQLAPEGSYRKYIRFFSGMILVLLLATPLLKIMNYDWEQELAEMEEMFESEIK